MSLQIRNEMDGEVIHMNDITKITFYSWGGGDNGTRVPVEVSSKDIAEEFVKIMGNRVYCGKLKYSANDILELMKQVLYEIGEREHTSFKLLNRMIMLNPEDILSNIVMVRIMGYLDFEGSMEDDSLMFFMTDKGKEYYESIRV